MRETWLPQQVRSHYSASFSPPPLTAVHDQEVHGGTGKQGDAALARKACEKKRIILAGGLTPENLPGILSEIPAWGVDVASGVEGPDGQQDLNRIRAFCDAAKRATQPDSK